MHIQCKIFTLPPLLVGSDFSLSSQSNFHSLCSPPRHTLMLGVTLLLFIIATFGPSSALRMAFSPVLVDSKSNCCGLSHSNSHDIVFHLSSEPTGKEANVKWRAVPMAHLRKHPHFISLPHPNDVTIGGSFLNLGLYRQDSWQWDALHSGRLTTSRLSGSLGFYEGNTALLIGVPRSLQSHSKALSSWQEMKSKAPTDWTFLSESKVTQSALDVSENPWTSLGESATVLSSFSCAYQPTAVEMTVGMRRFTNPSSARLAWGHVQEATAILVAVNYFTKHSPGCVVSESGMFSWEALQETIEHRQYLDQQAVLREILGSLPVPPTTAPSKAKKPNASTNSTAASAQAKLGNQNIYEVLNQWIKSRKLPVLGASPDGVIRHADGTVEVLEVKCTSPFVTFNTVKRTPTEEENVDIETGKRARAESGEQVASEKAGTCEINEDNNDSDTTSVAPTMTVMHGFGAHKPTNRAPFGVWHVPQLQLEMLCVGAHCRSAVILLYSISGAKLYRLERNDEVSYTKHYQSCILYQLLKSFIFECCTVYLRNAVHIKQVLQYVHFGCPVKPHETPSA